MPPSFFLLFPAFILFHRGPAPCFVGTTVFEPTRGPHLRGQLSRAKSMMACLGLFVPFLLAQSQGGEYDNAQYQWQ